MKKKSFWTKLLLSLIGISAIVALVSLIGIILLESDLPNVATLRDIHMQIPLRVYTNDNKLISEYGEVNRIPTDLNKIPKQLIHATLATEDQRFFSHSGVDLFGLARAGIILFLTGKKAEGGSTITMQVARNFFLTRKKTYTRKIKEILLALKIDHEFSKNKILSLYFNKIFYGHRAYGVAAAAQLYYGKSLDQLSLEQLAMLAGIPKAPSILNPLANKQAALNRRNHVLTRMHNLKYIDDSTYQDTIGTPLTASYHRQKITIKAPYVGEMVRQAMLKQFGEDSYSNGYKVYTTIDSKLQIAANDSVKNGLLAYDKRHGYRGAENNLGTVPQDLNIWINWLDKQTTINNLHPAIVLDVNNWSFTALLKNGKTIKISRPNMKWARPQLWEQNREKLGPQPKDANDIVKVGDVIRVEQESNNEWHLSQLPSAESALVALNPNNGKILALVGGFNYYKSKFNRIVQSIRQPGSSFKPFIYSAALAKGFTLATLINDAPVVTEDSGINNLWRPQNDTKEFYGPIRLRVALQKSRNLASIRLLQLIGIPYAIDYVTRFGFNRDQLPQTPSLALGTASITPLQQAVGFAVFANGGYKVNPKLIDHISDSNQKIIYQAKPLHACYECDYSNKNNENQPNLAPRVITPKNAYLMAKALKDVIRHGTGRMARVLHRNDLAGKTGTTNDHMDGWFCGFNSNIVTTVWLGFDKPRSIYEYAAKSALPIWINFMRDALKDQPESTMSQPSDIVTVRINKKTGLLTQTNDPDAIFEIFRKEYVPTKKDYSTYNSTDDKKSPATLEQIY